MNVKAIVDIPSRRGTIKAGTVFTIDPAALPKLSGKIEPVKLTPEEAATRIGKVSSELDKAGPWPGEMWNLLTPEARSRIQEANAAVDHAADVLKDPDAMDAALRQYKEAWMLALRIAQRRQS